MRGRVDKSEQAMSGKRLVLPAIVTVAVITQIPFVVTLILSFLRWNVRRPDLRIRFAMLHNYGDMLFGARFYHVLLNTMLITAIALVACAILGLALALLFNRDFRGAPVLRALILIPYFVPGSVSGLIWKNLMLDPSFGFNYYILKLFGARPIDFFGHFALGTIIILVTWQLAPFFYLILRAGLQNLSESVVESAMIDGARGFAMLFKIKIPSILGHFKIALMLGAINIWKVFDLIFVTTQGGPGTASSNLPYYAYRSAFYDWQIGQSATAAVLTVVIILVVITRFSRTIGKSL